MALVFGSGPPRKADTSFVLRCHFPPNVEYTDTLLTEHFMGC